MTRIAPIDFHRACKPTARPRLAPKRKPRRSGASAVHMHVGDTPRTLTTLNLGIGSTNWVGFLRQGMFRRRHSAGDATIREFARPVDRGWPDPQVRRLSLTLTGAGTLPEATDRAGVLSFWFIGRFLFSQTSEQAIAAIGAPRSPPWSSPRAGSCRSGCRAEHQG